MLTFNSIDLIDVGELHSNCDPPLQASILKRLFTEMRGGMETNERSGSRSEKLSPSLRGGGGGWGWGGLWKHYGCKVPPNRQRRGAACAHHSAHWAGCPGVPKATHWSHICLWACLGCLYPLTWVLDRSVTQTTMEGPCCHPNPLDFHSDPKLPTFRLVSKLGTCGANAPLRLATSAHAVSLCS